MTLTAKPLDRAVFCDNIKVIARGRLAQLDRALVSGTKGQVFESLSPAKVKSRGLDGNPTPLFYFFGQNSLLPDNVFGTRG